MNGIVGGTQSLAADQALAFLHFHFNYGMVSSPHEQAAGRQIEPIIISHLQSLEITVKDQRSGLS
jgi:hypothetical protein